MSSKLYPKTLPVLLILFVFFSGPAFALADDSGKPEANSQALEEMIVTASRRSTALKDAPVEVTVIDRRQIETSYTRTPDELLKDLSGIAYMRTKAAECGPGRVVTLRGINEQKRTLVLVDGVPMNDGVTGAVNWSLIPNELIERIEIVPGPMSALYGSGAMGGVINIITRTPKKKSETKARAGAGSLDTYEGFLSQGGMYDGFGYLLGGRYYETDGYIAVKEQKEYHSKTRREEKNLYGKFMVFPDDQSVLTTSVSYVHEDYNRGIRTDDQKNATGTARLTYERQSGPFNNLTATLYGQTLNREVELGARPDYARRDHTEKDDSLRVGEMLSLSFKPGGVHVLTLGIDSTYSKMDKKNEYDLSNRLGLAEGKQILASLFAQDEMKWGVGEDNQLIFTLGVRGDYCKSYDGSSSDTNPGRFKPVDETYNDRSWNALNPKFGLTFKYGEWTTLRLSGGRSFAAPTLFELYTVFTRGPLLLYGNPDLDPESALSGEFGVDQWISDKFLIRSAVYYTRGDDFISTREIAPFQYKVDNITEISAFGVNVDLRFQPVSAWTFYAWYKYNLSQIEKDESDPATKGNYLPFEPEKRAKFGIQTRVIPHVTVDFGVRYEGRRFTDIENSRDTMLDEYTTLDLTLSGKIGRHVGWLLSCENLTDNAYDVYGIPTELSEAPGLLVNGEISVEF